MVNIALGHQQLSGCQNGDRDHDGTIGIDELVRAVGHAVDHCEGDIEPVDYKHRIAHPSDPYLAFPATPDTPQWIKFTIRVSEPELVYFQNSALIPFHQQFVSQSLDPYRGWSTAEIDAVSLHADGQELVFGAVLYQPSPPYELGIQLVRQDAYTADEVIRYFSAVRAAIDLTPGTPVFYFPTFEQQESAAAQRETLAAAGIPLGTPARWIHGDVCYAMGWARGRLVYVPGDAIGDAYADGTLRPQDILLTDGVPAEVPFVAGVLSLAPSTPSSHVAILAGDWQIPFAFLAQSESVDAAQALVGREVVLRATTLTNSFATGEEIDPGACQVRLVDVTGALPDEVENHLRDLKRAPDLAIRPFVRSGTYSADVDTATPEDVVRVGGKAANYGFLRRAIPANSRPAIAFTFDLWNDYLDQPIDGGATLREQIAVSLAPYAAYPPSDFAALFDALGEVRDLIDHADFTPAQRSAVIAALAPFDPDLLIRFRSSTNVEDSDVFTGAGLYESESGCLADDLDDDDAGPSRCDATRPKERGVFRALRKVFQSFYNDNAYLERIRHRVDERTVGMAVLVNHTFTDDTELANGVATLRVESADSARLSIVSQPGAFSVTNPEDDGAPEVVEVLVFGDGRIPVLRQGSDRLPLGATVLQLPAEYTALTDLLLAVGDAFGAYHGETRFDIEFEYKKILGEGLDVKQVRRIPSLVTQTTPPVLIDAPMHLCTFQGEFGDVFANYRLKSRWAPSFVSGPLGDGAIYAGAPHQYALDGAIQILSGAPATWPEAEHGAFAPSLPNALGISDSWRVGSGASRRRLTLRTLVPTSVGPNAIPIVFPEDLGLALDAEYETPVPYLDYDGSTETRVAESVQLQTCLDERPLTSLHTRQQRTESRAGLTFASEYYWPPMPTGAVAGYTAPLDRWLGTTITGLSAVPAVVSGYFSQTYRPEHHNFAESFIVDPHLEPDLDPQVLSAFDARGIRALIARIDYGGASPLLALTADGRIVEVAAQP